MTLLLVEDDALLATLDDLKGEALLTRWQREFSRREAR